MSNLDEQIDYWVRSLSSHNAEHRREAARLLVEAGEPAVLPLCDSLLNRTARTAAADALGAIGDRRAVMPLVQSLPTANVSYCRTAARVLGGLGDGSAADGLIACVTSWTDPLGKKFDPDGDIEALCRTTAETLLRLRRYDRFLSFYNTLERQKSPFGYRLATVEQLGLLHNIGDIVFLIHALSHPHSLLRRRAALGLRLFGPADSLFRRIVLQTGLSVQERVALLETIGQIHFRDGDLALDYPMPDLLAYCRCLMRDEDPILRAEAAAMEGYYSLIRPSQRDTSTEDAQLLRGHSGGPAAGRSAEKAPGSGSEPGTGSLLGRILHRPARPPR